MSLDQIVNRILVRTEKAVNLKVTTDEQGSRFKRKFTKAELLNIASKLENAGFTPSIKGYYRKDAIFFETNDIYFSIDHDGFINFM